MASLLLVDVQELLISGAVRPIVRKKAALALLRLLRKSTSDIEELLTPEVRSKSPPQSHHHRFIFRCLLQKNLNHNTAYYSRVAHRNPSPSTTPG